MKLLLVPALLFASSGNCAVAPLPTPTLLDWLRFSLPAVTPVLATASRLPVAMENQAAETTPMPAIDRLTLSRVLGLRLHRIVIDAGHGGFDNGAVGGHGLREKDVVLDVARRVERLVREVMGIEAIMTRSEDVFVPLPRRSAIANEAQADLFLSIHANSAPSRAASGAEAFILSLNATDSAFETARRENAGSEHSVGQLQSLVRSIALHDKVQESETLAEMLAMPLSLDGTPADASRPKARNRGVRRAPFLVLLGAEMPAVLTEIGFLSNPAEAENLANPAYRQHVATAILAGLVQYSDSLSASSPSYWR